MVEEVGKIDEEEASEGGGGGSRERGDTWTGAEVTPKRRNDEKIYRDR